MVEEEKSLGQGRLLVEAQDLEIAVPVFPLTNLAWIGQGHSLHTRYHWLRMIPLVWEMYHQLRPASLRLFSTGTGTQDLVSIGNGRTATSLTYFFVKKNSFSKKIGLNLPAIF